MSRYVSMAERAGQDLMGWTALIEFVRLPSRDEQDALYQIAHAVKNGRLNAGWADGYNPHPDNIAGIGYEPDDGPPVRLDFWLHLEHDPTDRDRIREGKFWDDKLLGERRASQLGRVVN